MSPMTAGHPTMLPNGKHLRDQQNESFYNKGTWSDEEKRLFLIGFRQYGRGKWKKIGSVLTTRSRTQIKSHAQKVMARQAAGEDVFTLSIPHNSKRALKNASVPAKGVTFRSTDTSKKENDSLFAQSRRNASCTLSKPREPLDGTGPSSLMPPSKPSEVIFQAEFGAPNSFAVRHSFKPITQVAPSSRATASVVRPRAVPCDREDVFAAMMLCKISSTVETRPCSVHQNRCRHHAPTTYASSFVSTVTPDTTVDEPW